MLVLLPRRDIEIAIGLIEDDLVRTDPSGRTAMMSYIATLSARRIRHTGARDLSILLRLIDLTLQKFTVHPQFYRIVNNLLG